MKAKPLKKHTHSFLTPTLVATALSSQLALAGFTWVDNSGIGGAGVPYTTGTTETFEVDKPNNANHITTEFSANIDGTVSTDLFPVNTGDTPHKKIWFKTGEVIQAGTPLRLCFDFSHLIASDGDPTLTNTTAAIELRWFDLVPALSIDVELTGGLDTFKNQLNDLGGPLTPSGNGTIFLITDVVRSKGIDTTYNGFSDDDTANYTSIATSAAGGSNPVGMFNLVDTEQDNSDLSWQQACFTMTPDEDMAEGTVFQFTFGGADPVIVPEPSSAALLGLGGLALILRRRK